MAEYFDTKEAAEQFIKNSHVEHGAAPEYFGKILNHDREQWLVDYQRRDYGSAHFKVLANLSSELRHIISTATLPVASAQSLPDSRRIIQVATTLPSEVEARLDVAAASICRWFCEHHGQRIQFGVYPTGESPVSDTATIKADNINVNDGGWVYIPLIQGVIGSPSSVGIPATNERMGFKVEDHTSPDRTGFGRAISAPSLSNTGRTRWVSSSSRHQAERRHW
jgi:hypothetical protein